MTTEQAGEFNWAGQRILVTGAAGFIGSHLADRLLHSGACVSGFVRCDSHSSPGSGSRVDQVDGLKIVTGDIRDRDAVRRAMEGIDIVFHLAGMAVGPDSLARAQEVIEVNTLGTLNVLSAGLENGVKRIVQTSTSAVYGDATRIPIDEHHPRHPQTPYAASKIAADVIALSFYESFQLPVVICRLFNTYGPRQSGRAVIPSMIAQALDKDEIEVGNLAPTRDFTYVQDVVTGFLRLAEHPACVGEEINLGSGQEISIGDLVDTVIRLVGRDVKVKTSQERTRSAAIEAPRSCSDNSKARRLAGWSPSISLEEGLQATIDSVRASLIKPGS